VNEPFASSCSRTDAVLATHLDGDLREARAESGYGFVSDDRLQPHLRECQVCQRALQRARRLDAVLASTAGRAVAAHAAATGEPIEALGQRLLDNAIAAATTLPATAPTETTAAETTPSATDSEPQPAPTTGVAARAGKVSDELSLPWTLFAAAGLLAAGVATWLLLIEPRARADARGVAMTPTAHPATASDEATRDALEEHEAAENPLPLGLARHLNQRVRPEQATLGNDALAQRLADDAQPLAVRLSAGRRLLDAARGPAPRAREALDGLLVGLASLGDDSDAALALQDELLDELRDAPALRRRVATRIHELAAARPGPDDASSADVGALHDAGGSVALSRADLAALVVAARTGGARLDASLRRAMQRHAPLANVTTSALRSAARQQGSAALLLQGWQDQVALGHQQDSTPWAEFWFRGQSARTFEQVAAQLQRSRSVSERQRCLLALGCVGDGSTVALLRAHLRSANREEAFAATCALSSLPHSVLAPLLPEASVASASLLRTALARAGLPQAQPWIAGLSSSQRRLLIDARPEQFPEVTGWFREASAIAD